METVNSYLPATVWNAKKGHGSFITFDLGRLVEKKEGKGPELHLWVYMCDWRILCDEKLLLSSSVIDDKNKQLLSCFSAKKLLSIDIYNDKNEVVLNFDSKLKVSLDNNNNAYSDEDDFFMLFVEGRGVFSYSKSENFYHSLE